MIRVVTIVGARPQFIKAATVSRAFQRRSDVQESLVHTGQHYDENMSAVFFEELGIPEPRFHLGIGGGPHGAMTGAMLARVEEVLQAERPDWVLVYGDTNSTLAGALAATKLHVPVAHVEAGLRSFNRKMPEEVNRVLTDHVADLLFVPTEQGVRNLVREGIDAGAIRRVGDVMLDAARFYGARAAARTEALESARVSPRRYLLATIHRAENTDDPARLRGVIRCLNVAAERWPVVLPLHPRTRQAFSRVEPSIEISSNVRVIDPVGYLDMVALEMNAAVIATDSGGVQKEAYFHKVPCITLRDETEWVELVEAGWNVLAGADAERFAAALERLGSGAPMAWSAELYGDGRAAERVAEQVATSV
jgi:UDP-GlcNAc3NAcA epimerase